MKTFIVRSSSGDIIANSETGNVIECIPFLGSENEYITQIKRFNVEEYKAFYKIDEPHTDVDILDIGFDSLLVSGATRYSEPEPQFRNANWDRDYAII